MTQKLKKIYQFTFFTILLLFFVVGTAIPTYAQNYSKDYSNCILKEYGKFVYYLDPTDNTISITRGYKGTGSEDVIIPSEIEGKPVEIIGDSAFGGRSDLTGK